MPFRLPAAVLGLALSSALVVMAHASSEAAVATLRTSHVAPAGKPKPDMRTYVVKYTLTGTYRAVEKFTEADGFCDGTSNDETAHFSDSSTGTVKLVTGKAKQFVGGPAVSKTGALGTWSERVDAVSQGDDCANHHVFPCHNTLKGGNDESGTFLSAGTTATKVGFESTLTNLPTEDSDAGDCHQDQDYFPGLAFYLHDLLGPYDSVQTSVSWTRLEKLAKGQSLTKTAAYSEKPSGYSPATCSGESGCRGTVTKFVHTLTIKRTR